MADAPQQLARLQTALATTKGLLLAQASQISSDSAAPSKPRCLDASDLAAVEQITRTLARINSKGAPLKPLETAIESLVEVLECHGINNAAAVVHQAENEERLEREERLLRSSSRAVSLQ